ncbi:hypothetical protein [Campylobacter phage CJLB-12]|nr:hypothetical protein [Campylobacter phage CJLB-12]
MLHSSSQTLSELSKNSTSFDFLKWFQLLYL